MKNISRDILLKISYDLPMEDVWTLCQTNLLIKCNEDFWKNR